MSNYPLSIDTQLVIVTDTTPISSNIHNELRASILAIQNELGIKPSGIYGTVRERLNALDNRIDNIESGLGDTIPGGSNFAVQFNNNGIFGGASHVSISSDGALQLANDRANGAATVGDIRFSSGASMYAKDSDGTNRSIFTLFDKTLTIGAETNFSVDRRLNAVNVFGNRAAALTGGFINSLGINATQVGAGSGAFPGALTSNFTWAYPNFWINQYENLKDVNLLSDPFGDGYGYLLMADLAKPATGNPTNGFWMWSDPSNHHPNIKLPNGISYDLISSNAPGGGSRAIQFNNAGVFDGASHTSISSDGYFEVSNDRAGGVASKGDIRMPKNFSIWAKNNTGTADLPILRHQIFTNASNDGYLNSLQIASDGYLLNPKFDSVDILVSQTIGLEVYNSATLTDDVSLSLFGTNRAFQSPNAWNVKFIYAQPNIMLAPLTSIGNSLTYDPFKTGQGMIFMGDQWVAESGNPIGGFWLSSDPSNHHPRVKLPAGNWIDLISSNNPSGNNNSIQFNNSNAFGGATHASIASDGYLQISNDKPGNAALSGDIRVPYSFVINGRDKNNSRDLSLLGVAGSSGIPDGYQDNRLIIGGGATSFDYDTVEMYARGSWGATVQGYGEARTAGMFLFGDNLYGNGVKSLGTYIYPNLMLGTSTSLLSLLGSDPFSGGRGVTLIKDIFTLPSGNPTAGFYLWSDANTHEPTVQLPNGTLKSLVPQGNSSSVQFKNATTGGLAGASHAGISSDGYFELKKDLSSIVSTKGLIRVEHDLGASIPIIGIKDVNGFDRSLLMFDPFNAGGTVLGDLGLEVLSIVGSGIVHRGNDTIMVQNGTIFLFSTGTPQIPRFSLDTVHIYSSLPRHGMSTAWGASEGEVSISNSGPYTLSSSEFNKASNIFTAASSDGYFAYPAPTLDQSYLKFLTNTTNFDKLITIGSGTSFTLKANSKALVKFNPDGVVGMQDGYPGGALNSIQYNNGFKLAGASNTFIDSDGYIVINNQSNIKAKDHLGNEKAVIGKFSYDITDGTVSPVIMNGVVLGSDNTGNLSMDQIYARSKYLFDVSLDGYFDGDLTQGFGVGRYNKDGTLPSAWDPDTQAVFTIYPRTNLVFAGNNTPLNYSQHSSGGKGVIYIGNATINPSSNPTLGNILYSDASDGYLKYRQASGNVITINNSAPSASIPTGTGFTHITSGVQDSAAKLVFNADVDAAAAIAYSKINITGSIVNTDVSASAAISGTKISPDFGSQTIATTGPLTIGTNVPTTGGIRLGNNQFVYTRDAGNTGNFPLIGLNTTNDLFIGNNSTPSAHLHLLAANGKQIDGYIGGSIVMTIAGSLNTFTNPIAIGTTPATSGQIRVPYNGGSSFDILTARNSANSANVPIIQTNGTITAIGDYNRVASTNVWGSTVSIQASSSFGVQLGAISSAIFGTGGIQFLSVTPSFGGGSGVIGITNATTNPTTNPTGGLVAYVDAADGYFKTRTRDGYVVSLNGTISKLIINTDVASAAAIAGTKIAPDFGSQNVVTTGFVSVGSSTAQSGSFRLPNAAALSFRNAANSSDIIGIALTSSNDLTFGSTAANTSRFAAVNTAFNGFTTFGGGLFCIGIANANTVPSSNPTGGIIAYVNSADGYLSTRTAAGGIYALNGTASFLQSGGTTVISADSSSQITMKNTTTIQTGTNQINTDVIANVATTNATQTTLYSWTLDNNAVTTIDIRVTAKGSAAADAWVGSATFLNLAGTITDIETANITQRGSSAWSVTISRSSTTVSVKVTGSASTNLNWVGTISRQVGT